MVPANRYFKGVGSTQSHNTVFHFLYYSQESLRYVCFLQFSLTSVQPLPFHISLRNLQIAHGNRFPWGNYHHFSFIRAIKRSVLTMSIQKICHKGLLHLQKIVSQPFSANREPHTVIANLTVQKWHAYHHGCQGRKLQPKNFIFTRRKIDQTL